jgi:precorrin-2/cobalt-factor-2 C20-methyltransferase
MVTGEAMTGALIGLGVGPGDPEVLTLKGARVLRRAKAIAYVALHDVPSLARSIVAKHLPPTLLEIRIDLTMTADREPAQTAYDAGAEQIAEVLNAGTDVICLCEGDALFYGSFMYLAARLSDRFPVQVIPGVNSISAATAQAVLPLTARNEVVAILPATLPDAQLRDGIDAADSVVIMKLGRHLPRVRALLNDMNVTATYVERASLPNSLVTQLDDAPDEAPYFSLLLITKGNDPWLSR